ncbi:MAG: phosphomannomutase/phosphoglucomutase [Pseudomonadales bacterium]
MAKQNNSAPSDIRKAIEPDQSLFKFSLLSLLGSCFGIAVAAVMLYTLVISGSNRQLADTIFDAHATAYANHINQSTNQLQSHLDHLSDSTAVRHAFADGSSKALTALEQQLLDSLPNLIGIRLIRVGEQILTPAQTGLSFPEIDMVNRASRNQSVSAEAHPLNQQRVIRLASRVKESDNSPIIGVIIATYSMDVISQQLSLFNTANGSMKIEQTYSGKKPQSFFQYGGNFNSEQPVLTVPLQNPLWQISFQPSIQLAKANNLSPIAFWTPIGIALGIVLISILYAYTRLRNSVRNDAISLVNYCRQLIQDDAGRLPNFRLSLFHSMAKTLTITDREQVLEEKVAPKQAPQQPADNEPPSASEAMQVNDSLHAELDEEDLLDLDLVGAEDNDSPPSAFEANATSQAAPAPQPVHRDIPASIFRAYDIRGIIGDTLDTDIAYRIGQAVGSEATAQGESGVVVGADGRLSSPELSAALIQGIRDSGQDVINVGMVPTPLVYFATQCMEAKSGVMITGSHNPADYNGFKIVIAGKTLANEEIQALYQRIMTNDFSHGHGELDDVDIVEHYIEHVNNDIALAKPLRVVVDCGNGVASVVAPRLLEDIGCTVIPLYCEVDGTFPNHHPDPGKPENLQDLINAVAEHNADIGLAFDGDGDRLGVVTNAGSIIWPDRLMMLFAKDVASRNPGADIIYDVKCSRRLAGLISSYGGRPIMWKTGHSLIKAKMAETGALLAGEMSGHIFFKERWFGFDDGIYSAARLLEIVGSETVDSETLFEAFPDDISTPELNVNVTEDNKFSLIEQLKQRADFNGADVSTIDGIRADFENGWGLVRASNTTPVLVLRFGAEDETVLSDIQAHFKRELLAIAPELEIPF